MPQKNNMLKKLLIIHPDHKLTALYKNEATKFFSVDSAHDGLSGLRAIKQMSPDIIFSEYHLPDISGSTILKFVRSHPTVFAAPFIFLSSNHPAPEVLGLGANDWRLVSETSPEYLISLSHQHLKLKPLIYV